MTTIHLIPLRFSNAYLLTGDHPPIIIDTGSPGDLIRLEGAFSRLGVVARDLGLILHTHVHSDHFGNTAALASIAKCPVSFHLNDQEIAGRGFNGPLKGVGLRGKVLAPFFRFLRFQPIDSDFPAFEGLRLDQFGVGAKILQTPGHTPGSISILMDNGDAIIGDLIMGGFAGGLVRPKRPNFHYFAEDFQKTMESLEKILTQSSGKLFVGHGGPLNHSDLVAWRQSRRFLNR